MIETYKRQINDAVLPTEELVWFYQNGFFLDWRERRDVERHFAFRRRSSEVAR